MSDRWPRAQLIHLEVQRLSGEAQSCVDPDRMVSIKAEMDVLYGSLLDLRREQLMEQIDPPEPERKRRWWCRKGDR